MLRSLLVAAALATAVPAVPALAADGGATVRVQISDRDGHRHRDRDHDRRDGRGWDGDRRGHRDWDNHHNQISRGDALRIATRQGVARVHDVDYRHGVWEVSGRTRRGSRIEVEISARSGRVLDVDYGRR